MEQIPTSGEEARTSVLLVDDHRAFSETLALAIGLEPDLACVGIAQSAGEAAALAEELQPDVAVVDVRLDDADGLDAARELRARSPRTRLLVLTGYLDADSLTRAAAMGVSAYLAKSAPLRDVLNAIRVPVTNRFVVDGHAIDVLTSSERAPAPRRDPNRVLTPREHEVLVMLADGLDVKTIARQLDISVNTCRGHVKRILAKLGAHSQLGAVAIARRDSLIPH